MLRCIVGALLIGAVGFLSASLHAQGVFKKPSPGEVYKEYMQIISVGSDDWRVTDPNINTTTYPAAAAFLPNPTLYIDIDDLDGATRAEALFSVWGGHIGTSGKKVSFNGNSWITIPELATTPTDPYNYIHQAMIGSMSRCLISTPDRIRSRGQTRGSSARTALAGDSSDGIQLSSASTMILPARRMSPGALRLRGAALRSGTIPRYPFR
jgi:hypothetical protein